MKWDNWWKPGYSLHWGKRHDEIIGRFTRSKCWIVGIIIPCGETNLCFSFVFVKLGLSFAILVELQRRSREESQSRCQCGWSTRSDRFLLCVWGLWKLQLQMVRVMVLKVPPLENRTRWNTQKPTNWGNKKHKTPLSWTKVCSHICVCAEQLFWW